MTDAPRKHPDRGELDIDLRLRKGPRRKESTRRLEREDGVQDDATEE